MLFTNADVQLHIGVVAHTQPDYLVEANTPWVKNPLAYMQIPGVYEQRYDFQDIVEGYRTVAVDDNSLLTSTPLFAQRTASEQASTILRKLIIADEITKRRQQRAAQFQLHNIRDSERYQKQMEHEYAGVMLDIDGTITLENGMINKEIFDKIYQLLSEGIPVTIVTGRTINGVMPLINLLRNYHENLYGNGKEQQQALEERLQNLFFFVENGAYGIKADSLETIADNKFPTETITHEEVREEIARLSLSFDRIPITDHSVIIVPTDEANLQSYTEAINDYLKQKGYPLHAINTGHTINILPQGVHKGAAVKAMAEFIKQQKGVDITTDDLLKIGDSGQETGNDYEMLSSFGGFSVNKFGKDVLPIVDEQGRQRKGYKTTLWLLNNLKLSKKPAKKIQSSSEDIPTAITAELPAIQFGPGAQEVVEAYYKKLEAIKTALDSNQRDTTIQLLQELQTGVEVDEDGESYSVPTLEQLIQDGTFSGLQLEKAKKIKAAVEQFADAIASNELQFADKIIKKMDESLTVGDYQKASQLYQKILDGHSYGAQSTNKAALGLKEIQSNPLFAAERQATAESKIKYIEGRLIEAKLIEIQNLLDKKDIEAVVQSFQKLQQEPYSVQDFLTADNDVSSRKPIADKISAISSYLTQQIKDAQDATAEKREQAKKQRALGNKQQADRLELQAEEGTPVYSANGRIISTTFGSKALAQLQQIAVELTKISEDYTTAKDEQEKARIQELDERINSITNAKAAAQKIKNKSKLLGGMITASSLVALAAGFVSSNPLLIVFGGISSIIFSLSKFFPQPKNRYAKKILNSAIILGALFIGYKSLPVIAEKQKNMPAEASETIVHQQNQQEILTEKDNAIIKIVVKRLESEIKKKNKYNSFSDYIIHLSTKVSKSSVFYIKIGEKQVYFTLNGERITTPKEIEMARELDPSLKIRLGYVDGNNFKGSRSIQDLNGINFRISEEDESQRELQQLALSVLNPQSATDAFIDANFKELSQEQLAELKSLPTAEQRYDYLTKLGWSDDKIAIRAGGAVDSEVDEIAQPQTAELEETEIAQLTEYTIQDETTQQGLPAKEGPPTEQFTQLEQSWFSLGDNYYDSLSVDIDGTARLTLGGETYTIISDDDSPLILDQESLEIARQKAIAETEAARLSEESAKKVSQAAAQQPKQELPLAETSFEQQWFALGDDYQEALQADKDGTAFLIVDGQKYKINYEDETHVEVDVEQSQESAEITSPIAAEKIASAETLILPTAKEIQSAKQTFLQRLRNLAGNRFARAISTVSLLIALVLPAVSMAKPPEPPKKTGIEKVEKSTQKRFEGYELKYLKNVPLDIALQYEEFSYYDIVSLYGKGILPAEANKKRKEYLDRYGISTIATMIVKGISPELAMEYPEELDGFDIIKLNEKAITPELLQEQLKPYAGIEVDDAVNMLLKNIPPEYSFLLSYDKDFSIDELVKLSQAKIPPDYFKTYTDNVGKLFNINEVIEYHKQDYTAEQAAALSSGKALIVFERYVPNITLYAIAFAAIFGIAGFAYGFLRKLYNNRSESGGLTAGIGSAGAIVIGITAAIGVPVLLVTAPSLLLGSGIAYSLSSIIQRRNMRKIFVSNDYTKINTLLSNLNYANLKNNYQDKTYAIAKDNSVPASTRIAAIRSLNKKYQQEKEELLIELYTKNPTTDNEKSQNTNIIRILAEIKTISALQFILNYFFENGYHNSYYEDEIIIKSFNEDSTASLLDFLDKLSSSDKVVNRLELFKQIDYNKFSKKSRALLEQKLTAIYQSYVSQQKEEQALAVLNVLAVINFNGTFSLLMKQIEEAENKQFYQSLLINLLQNLKSSRIKKISADNKEKIKQNMKQILDSKELNNNLFGKSNYGRFIDIIPLITDKLSIDFSYNYYQNLYLQQNNPDVKKQVLNYIAVKYKTKAAREFVEEHLFDIDKSIDKYNNPAAKNYKQSLSLSELKEKSILFIQSDDQLKKQFGITLAEEYFSRVYYKKLTTKASRRAFVKKIIQTIMDNPPEVIYNKDRNYYGSNSAGELYSFISIGYVYNLFGSPDYLKTLLKSYSSSKNPKTRAFVAVLTDRSNEDNKEFLLQMLEQETDETVVPIILQKLQRFIVDSTIKVKIYEMITTKTTAIQEKFFQSFNEDQLIEYLTDYLPKDNKETQRVFYSAAVQRLDTNNKEVIPSLKIYAEVQAKLFTVSSEVDNIILTALFKNLLFTGADASFKIDEKLFLQPKDIQILAIRYLLRFEPQQLSNALSIETVEIEKIIEQTTSEELLFYYKLLLVKRLSINPLPEQTQYDILIKQLLDALKSNNKEFAYESAVLLSKIDIGDLAAIIDILIQYNKPEDQKYVISKISRITNHNYNDFLLSIIKDKNSRARAEAVSAVFFDQDALDKLVAILRAETDVKIKRHLFSIISLRVEESRKGGETLNLKSFIDAIIDNLVFVKEYIEQTSADYIQNAILQYRALLRADLIRKLDDEDIKTRIAAILFLRTTIVQEDDLTEIINALLKKIEDKSSEVKITAAQALGIIAENIPDKSKLEPAILPLITALGDKDESVRNRAVQALVNIGEPAILPLIAALSDEDANVRLGAVQVLIIIIQTKYKRGIISEIWKLISSDISDDERLTLSKELAKLDAKYLSIELRINIKLARYLKNHPENFKRLLNHTFREQINELAYHLSREQTVHPTEHRLEEDEKTNLFDLLFSKDDISKEKAIFDEFFKNNPQDYSVDVESLTELLSYMNLDEISQMIKLMRDDPKLTVDEIFTKLEIAVQQKHSAMNAADRFRLNQRLKWLIQNSFIIESQLSTINDMLSSDSSVIISNEDLIKFLKQIDKTKSLEDLLDISKKSGISLENILQFKMDTISILAREELIISILQNIAKVEESFRDTLYNIALQNFGFLSIESRRRVYMNLLFNQNTDNAYITNAISQILTGNQIKIKNEYLNKFFLEESNLLRDYSTIVDLFSTIPQEQTIRADYLKSNKELFSGLRSIYSRKKFKQQKGDDEFNNRLLTVEGEIAIKQSTIEQIPHLFYEHLLRNTFNTELDKYDTDSIDYFRSIVSRVKIAKLKNDLRTVFLVWNIKTHTERSKIFISLLTYLKNKYALVEDGEAKSNEIIIELTKRLSELEQVLDSHIKATNNDYKDSDGKLLAENAQLLGLSTIVLNNLAQKKEIEQSSIDKILEIRGKLRSVDLLLTFKKVIQVENEEAVLKKLTEFTQTQKFKRRDHQNRDMFQLISLFLAAQGSDKHFYDVMLRALIHEIDGSFEDWKFSSPDYIATLNEIIDIELKKLPDEQREAFAKIDGESNLEKLENADQSIESYTAIKDRVERIRNWERQIIYPLNLGGDLHTIEYVTNFFDLFNIGNYPGSTACQSCVYGNSLNAGLLGYVNNGAITSVALMHPNGYVETRRIIKLRIIERADGEKLPVIYVEENTQFGSRELEKLYKILEILSVKTGLPVASSIKRTTNGESFKLYTFKGTSEWEYSDTYGGRLHQTEKKVERQAHASIEPVPEKTIQEIEQETGLNKVEPNLSELTKIQFDKLVRNGITITSNPDSTKTVDVHILIDFTEEQRKAIDKAVNDYIDDYEGLVERIKELLTRTDDFTCKIGSCSGKAQLPSAASTTAEVELEEVVIGRLDKYTLPETIEQGLPAKEGPPAEIKQSKNMFSRLFTAAKSFIKNKFVDSYIKSNRLEKVIFLASLASPIPFLSLIPAVYIVLRYTKSKTESPAQSNIESNNERQLPTPNEANLAAAAVAPTTTAAEAPFSVSSDEEFPQTISRRDILKFLGIGAITAAVPLLQRTFNYFKRKSILSDIDEAYTFITDDKALSSLPLYQQINLFLEQLKQQGIITENDKVSISIHNPETDTTLVNHKSDDQHLSGSIIKLFIMAAVFNKLQTASLSEEETAEVNFHLKKMMENSSNQSADYLINFVGGLEAVQQFIKTTEIFTETELLEYIAELDGKTYKNKTSAADLTIILQLLYQNKLISETASERMLDLIAGYKTSVIEAQESITKRDSVTKIVGKTGHVNGLSAETAIIYYKDKDGAIKPFIVSVMIENDNMRSNDEQTAAWRQYTDKIIAKIALLSVNAHEQDLTGTEETQKLTKYKSIKTALEKEVGNLNGVSSCISGSINCIIVFTFEQKESETEENYQVKVKQTKELIELTIEEIIAKHVGIDSNDKSITTKVYFNEDGTITVDVEHDFIGDIKPEEVTKEIESVVEAKIEVNVVSEREFIELILSKEIEQLSEDEINFILNLDLDELKRRLSPKVFKKLSKVNQKLNKLIDNQEEIEYGLGPKIEEQEYSVITKKIQSFLTNYHSNIDQRAYSEIGMAFIVEGSLVTGWSPEKNRPSDSDLFGKEHFSDLDLLILVDDAYWESIPDHIKLKNHVIRTLAVDIDSVWLIDFGLKELILQLGQIKIAGKVSREINIVLIPMSVESLKVSDRHLIYQNKIDVSQLINKYSP